LKLNKDLVLSGALQRDSKRAALGGLIQLARSLAKVHHARHLLIDVAARPQRLIVGKQVLAAVRNARAHCVRRDGSDAKMHGCDYVGAQVQVCEVVRSYGKQCALLPRASTMLPTRSFVASATAALVLAIVVFHGSVSASMCLPLSGRAKFSVIDVSGTGTASSSRPSPTD
jgi:hypothetical protein